MTKWGIVHIPKKEKKNKDEMEIRKRRRRTRGKSECHNDDTIEAQVRKAAVFDISNLTMGSRIVHGTAPNSN